MIVNWNRTKQLQSTSGRVSGNGRLEPAYNYGIMRSDRSKQIEIYREQQEKYGKIVYEDKNEESMYRFEQAFCKYCPAIDMKDENE